MAPGTGSSFSLAARQRDLLPLPEPDFGFDPVPLGRLSRGCRQRVTKRLARQDRCQSAVAAINVLSCGGDVVAPCGHSVAQIDAIDHMKEVVLEQVPPPDVPTPDEALLQLLRSGGKYD